MPGAREFSVRPCRPEDAAAVRELVVSVLEDEFGVPYRRSDIERLAAVYGPPGLFLVALADNRIVGCGGVKLVPLAAPLPDAGGRGGGSTGAVAAGAEGAGRKGAAAAAGTGRDPSGRDPPDRDPPAGAARVALLKRLYVERDWRGRGVGSALYRALEAHCRGCAGIFLDTAPGMAVARRFYRRHGFREVAEPLVPSGELREDCCLRYFWKPLG